MVHNQEIDIYQLLNRFNIADCKLVDTSLETKLNINL